LDYRGIAALLKDCPDLCAAIELEVVPHFTTLQKAADRLLTMPRANRLLKATIDDAQQSKVIGRRIDQGAMDSSGFEAHHVSRYFVRRRETGGKFKGKMHSLRYRRFPKLALLGDCQSNLILAALPERGPSPDFGHADSLITKAQERVRMYSLAADAGYDAEWIHMFARLIYGTRTIIPPRHGRPTAKRPRGYFRRLMSCRFNKKRYGQRWQVETIFSTIKRRLSDCLGARKSRMQRRALNLKVVVYNLMIVALLRKVFYRASYD
jgi:transposase